MSKELISPIFIVGCERSGTTFFAKELGKKIRVPVVPEAQFFVQLYELINKVKKENKVVLIEQICSFLEKNFRYSLWCIKDTEQVVKECINNNGFDVGLFMHKIMCINTGVNDSVVSWLDHTPGNVRYGKVINKIYPNAKILHLIRDGRAVAASLMNVSWGPTDMYSSAKYWLERIGFGIAMESGMGVNTVKRVYYEDLIKDKDGVLNGVYKWIYCNGKRVDEPISIPEYKISDYTKKQHKLVELGAVSKRVSAWKEELSNEQIREFEYYSGDLLGYLGYEMMYSGCGFYEDNFSKIKKILKRAYNEKVLQSVIKKKRVNAIN